VDQISRDEEWFKGKYNTHRGHGFERCVGLSYLIENIRESSPLKTASPISIVCPLLDHRRMATIKLKNEQKVPKMFQYLDKKIVEVFFLGEIPDFNYFSIWYK
jgi:hypothetical protein